MRIMKNSTEYVDTWEEGHFKNPYKSPAEPQLGKTVA